MGVGVALVLAVALGVGLGVAVDVALVVGGVVDAEELAGAEGDGAPGRGA